VERHGAELVSATASVCSAMYGCGMVASLWRGYVWELMYRDGDFLLPQVDGWIRSWGDGLNGLEEFCLNVFPRS